MSSIFDSETAARRKGNDYLKPDLWYMLRLIVSKRGGQATVTVTSRPAVSSRMWWTIRWPGRFGQDHQVSSERLELAAWRAIVIEEREARIQAAKDEEDRRALAQCEPR